MVRCRWRPTSNEISLENGNLRTELNFNYIEQLNYRLVS